LRGENSTSRTMHGVYGDVLDLTVTPAATPPRSKSEVYEQEHAVGSDHAEHSRLLCVCLCRLCVARGSVRTLGRGVIVVSTVFGGAKFVLLTIWY